MEEMVIHVELASESKYASVYFLAFDSIFLSQQYMQENHTYCNLFNMLT
jgi:hypothetical protein